MKFFLQMCTVLQPSAGPLVVRLWFWKLSVGLLDLVTALMSWDVMGKWSLSPDVSRTCWASWMSRHASVWCGLIRYDPDPDPDPDCADRYWRLFKEMTLSFNQHRDSGPPAKIYKNCPDSIIIVSTPLWFRTSSVLVKDTGLDLSTGF